MIVDMYKGGGRQARPVPHISRGGVLYRLFMGWFGTDRLRA